MPNCPVCGEGYPDGCPMPEIDQHLHELQVARNLRIAIDNYRLWEPGRAGHAKAHRDLMEVRKWAGDPEDE